MTLSPWVLNACFDPDHSHASPYGAWEATYNGGNITAPAIPIFTTTTREESAITHSRRIRSPLTWTTLLAAMDTALWSRIFKLPPTTAVPTGCSKPTKVPAFPPTSSCSPERRRPTPTKTRITTAAQHFPAGSGSPPRTPSTPPPGSSAASQRRAQSFGRRIPAAPSQMGSGHLGSLGPTLGIHAMTITPCPTCSNITESPTGATTATTVPSTARPISGTRPMRLTTSARQAMGSATAPTGKAALMRRWF